MAGIRVGEALHLRAAQAHVRFAIVAPADWGSVWLLGGSRFPHPARASEAVGLCRPRESETPAPQDDPRPHRHNHEVGMTVDMDAPTGCAEDDLAAQMEESVLND